MPNPQSPKRHFPRIIAATVLLTGVALAGCSASNSASPSTTSSGASTTTPDLSGVTLNVADQLKEYQTAFKAAGVDNAPYKINWSNFVGGPPIIAAEVGGSVDLGAMAETPTIFAQAAGDPVKVVSVSQATPNSGSPYAIVVPTGSSVTSVNQLKGKTVTVQEGTVEQYVLVALLKDAGLSYKDVHISNLNVIAGATALETNNVDAASTSYPFVAQITQAGKGKVLKTGAGVTKTLTYLTASDAALGDPGKEAAIADFISRFHKAELYLASHRALAASQYVQEYGVSPAVAAATVKVAQTVPTPITPAIISYQQQEADTFTQLGLISSKLNVSKIFDTRFNSAVEEFLKQHPSSS